MTDPEAMRLVAEGMVSIEDAVTQCGMGRTWLYQEMRSGRLPYAVFGRRRLIPAVALREYLAKVLAESVGAKADQDAFLNYGR